MIMFYLRIGMADELIVLPYTAVSLSIIARFIFMYLLYTKQSTNVYSLTFCGLSIVSSSIWIPYGILQNDVPIIVRSGVEILLLSLSGIYILRNRCVQGAKQKLKSPLSAKEGGPHVVSLVPSNSFGNPQREDRSWSMGVSL